MKRNRFNQMQIDLQELLSDAKITRIKTGHSNADVYKVEKTNKVTYLKVLIDC